MPFFGGGNFLSLQSTQRMPGTLSARLSARGARRAWARGSAPKTASGRERGRSFPGDGSCAYWAVGGGASKAASKKIRNGSTVPTLLLCLFGRGHVRQHPPSLAVPLLCFGFIISIYLHITHTYVCYMCVYVCVCYLVCRIGISAIKVATVVGLLLKPSVNTVPGTS